MDSHHLSEESRLAALSSRMGRLWSEYDEIDVWDEPPPTEQLHACRNVLVGTILSNPTINPQALQSTLSRVWKVDNVEITQREAGLLLLPLN